MARGGRGKKKKAKGGRGGKNKIDRGTIYHGHTFLRLSQKYIISIGVFSRDYAEAQRKKGPGEKETIDKKNVVSKVSAVRSRRQGPAN